MIVLPLLYDPLDFLSTETMIIIIDSNNLLGHPASRVTHTMRKELSLRLARYAAKTSHSVLLVFDGGREPLSTRVTHQLTIIDAGPTQTADMVITDLCTHYPAESVVIITKDRTLRIMATSKSIATVTPEHFMQRVALREQNRLGSSKKHAPQIIRYGEHSSPIDDIMEKAAAEHTPHKEPLEQSSRKSEPQRLSQSEKAYESLLNKL